MKDGKDLPLFPEQVDTSKLPSGPCAYCGRTYWLDGARMAVIHEIPYCAEFEAMDGLDYARACRVARQGKVAKA